MEPLAGAIDGDGLGVIFDGIELVIGMSQSPSPEVLRWPLRTVLLFLSPSTIFYSNISRNHRHRVDREKLEGYTNDGRQMWMSPFWKDVELEGVLFVLQLN